MEQEFQMDLDDLEVNDKTGFTSRYHSDDEMLDEPENVNGVDDDGYVEDFITEQKKQEVEQDIGIKLKKVLKDLNDGSLLRFNEDHSNEFSPPENFSPVVGKIYRSSFPRLENFEYLKKLNLKTILFLVPEEYPEENLKFAKENDINVFQVSMSGNKEPFVKIPDEVLTKALEIAINPQNHPLLIHCNRGKHRTGCLVGCIRRLQNWSLTMILDEYRRFAAPKIRPLDQQFIELYNDTEIIKTARENGWLPIQW